MDPEKLKWLYRVAVIGNTGVGKSALCNYLSGKQDGTDRAFPVSSKIDSCTYKTTAQVVKWLGSGDDFVLVDTPGFGDSSGKDSLNISNMVKKLKRLHHVSVFLILFNSQNPRLDESLKAMIEIFTQIFGRGRFFENVVLGFTRYDHSESAENRRIRSGETRSNREAEFNRYFREAFQVQKPLPAVFIDAYPNPKDKAEIKTNIKEVEKLTSITEDLEPFPLEDAEIVRGYLDQMKDKVAEASNRADAAEQQAKKNAEVWERDREAYEKERKEIKAMLDEEKKKRSNRIGIGIDLGSLGNIHFGFTLSD